MWLSRQAAARAREEHPADVGVVSIGAAAPAVVTDGEVRDLALFAPGGYAWRPAAGEQVLVLKAGATGAVAGARVKGAGLAAGEVLIFSPGGASIRLGADGSLELVGKVKINGVPWMGGLGGGTEAE